MCPATGWTGFAFPASRGSDWRTRQRATNCWSRRSGRCRAPVKVGFEATGGQEWVLWATLVAAEIDAGQLPPAQIKAFALSRGTRAKTDRIDAELIARFMLFRPEAGRTLPSEKLTNSQGLDDTKGADRRHAQTAFGADRGTWEARRPRQR